MLAALCAPHVPTLATHRNHNNRLGLPLTLFRLEPQHALCICELGTQRGRRAGRPRGDRRARHRRDHEHRARAPGVPGRSRGRRARGGLAARGALPPGRRCRAAGRRAAARSLPPRATCARRRSASPAATCAASPGSPGADGTRAVLDVLGERGELVVPLRAAHHAAESAPRQPPPTSAPGLPLDGLGAGAGDDRALAAARAGAGARAAAACS